MLSVLRQRRLLSGELLDSDHLLDPAVVPDRTSFSSRLGPSVLMRTAKLPIGRVQVRHSRAAAILDSARADREKRPDQRAQQGEAEDPAEDQEGEEMGEDVDEDIEEDAMDDEEQKLMDDLQAFDKDIVPKGPKDPLENAPKWLKDWPTKEVTNSPGLSVTSWFL